MADSIVLEFAGANVIQFLTTSPGTSFARLIDFPIGSGYTNCSDAQRNAIYNPHDDKMYFIGEKEITARLGAYTTRVWTRTNASGTYTIVSQDGTGTPAITTAQHTNVPFNSARFCATGTLAGKLTLEEIKNEGFDVGPQPYFWELLPETGALASPQLGASYTVTAGSLSDAVVTTPGHLPNWTTATAPVVEQTGSFTNAFLRYNFRADDAVASDVTMTFVQYAHSALPSNTGPLITTVLHYNLALDQWSLQQIVQNNVGTVLNDQTVVLPSTLTYKVCYLVKYDPRTLSVVDEVELPRWFLPDIHLYDCTEERAWVRNNISNSVTGVGDNSDRSTLSFDTATMTQVFTDGGEFAANIVGSFPYPGAFMLYSVMASCGNGIILAAELDDTVEPPVPNLRKYTITGSTTFTSAVVALDNFIAMGVDGAYRRQWNQALNLFAIAYEDVLFTGLPALGIVLDVAAFTWSEIPFPAVWGGSGSMDISYGPFWDTDTNQFVVKVSYGSSAMGVFAADGTYVGGAGIDSFEWDSGSPAMPLGQDLAWSLSLVFFGAGGFSMSVPTATPEEIYESTSSISIPSEIGFEGIRACIAPGFVPPEPPVEPPRMETSIGGGGSCGVQVERLEMFHLIKSLMGGGRTLEQAMKFLEEEDVDFLEEEGYMDDLPEEIPLPARQGTSPKMMDRRINLAPITKLNSLIAEFETKLQNCRTTQRREYDK